MSDLNDQEMRPLTGTDHSGMGSRRGAMRVHFEGDDDDVQYSEVDAEMCESEFSEGVDPEDPDTWPEEQQLVYYQKVVDELKKKLKMKNQSESATSKMTLVAGWVAAAALPLAFSYGTEKAKSVFFGQSTPSPADVQMQIQRHLQSQWQQNDTLRQTLPSEQAGSASVPLQPLSLQQTAL